MLKVSDNIELSDNEIEISPIGAKGPGGQSVNKSSTAVHLRFDIRASSLSEEYKQKLLNLSDQRVTKSGVIVIKSMRYRSLDDNRKDAVQKLSAMIIRAVAIEKERKSVKPGINARQRRMDQKTRRSRIKSLRGKVNSDAY